MKKIIILHQYGAPSHYRALVDTPDFDVSFVEFDLIKQVKRLLFGQKRFEKIVSNILFFIRVGFKRDLSIIIGIAPFDPRIVILWPFIQRHNIYWHTSWSDFTESAAFPYPEKHFIVGQFWRKFLSKISVIYFVNKSGLESFSGSYPWCLAKKRVVMHSIRVCEFLPSKGAPRKKNIIFIGRIEKNKGVDVLRDLVLSDEFKASGCTLHVVGKGKEEGLLRGLPNIKFHGYLSHDLLQEHLKSSSILLLPSRRESGWEEVFGLVVLEAMSFGVVPLCTDHAGPRMILQDFPELCVTEEEYPDAAKSIISSPVSDELRVRLFHESLNYSSERIARLWGLHEF